MNWIQKIFFVVFTLSASIIELKAQIITTFAGGGSSFGDGGPATAAALNAPNKCIFDKYGNFYFAEPLEGRIRKIDTNGNISTVAGTGTNGYNGDNISATSAELNNPPAIIFDAMTNLYIADGANNRIRKVDAVTGIITTVAGIGEVGYNGDNIPATSAKIYSPTDISFDKTGNLFIADWSNGRVRKVDTMGIITTFAGTGVIGTSGDGGPATSATFKGIYGLAVDDTGNLFIADWDGGQIRKVNTSGIISTFAGTGLITYNGDGISANAANIAPLKITFNNIGELCIADDPNDRIRMIDNSGNIHTIAGNGGCCYSGDNGPADSAEIGGVAGVAIDSCGNIYISQVDNPRIRKVTFNPPCFPEKLPAITTNEVSMHPNPAVNELYVETVSSNAEYVLFNITGIIEQTGTLQTGSNRIDVSNLPMGLYILMLTTEDGQRVVKKVVKE